MIKEYNLSAILIFTLTSSLDSLLYIYSKINLLFYAKMKRSVAFLKRMVESKQWCFNNSTGNSFRRVTKLRNSDGMGGRGR